MAKHTLNELGNMSREELITIILSMQGQLDALNENIEKLIEQVRLANSYRFGRHTETLKSIDGQLSFFDEAETLFDASAQEPSVEEAVVVTRKKKSKGQRELNLKAFPEEAVPWSVLPDRFLRSSNRRIRSQTDLPALFSRSAPASGSLPPRSGHYSRLLRQSEVLPPASSVPSPPVLLSDPRCETTPPVPADTAFLLPVRLLHILYGVLHPGCHLP